MRASRRILVDANAIIEAVRTGSWAAITGQLEVESVVACRDETLSGSPVTVAGYVRVTPSDLSRMRAVHEVDDTTRAAFKLAYANADGMDAGEHDLLAYARSLTDVEWAVCSPDKASIRAAVALGLGDYLCSLEELADAVGVRPKPPLRRQYTSLWLKEFRTRVLLEET